MRVKGERWEFSIGNNIIIVENAWHWSGYSQERVRLNDEVITEREGWGWFVIKATTIAEFEILDVPHDVVVGIHYEGTDYSIYCRVITETEVFKPDDWSEGKWDTKTYKWPPDPDPYALN